MSARSRLFHQTCRPGARPGRNAVKAMLWALLLSMGLAGHAEARDPEELYRAGQFEEAAALYAALDMDHPKVLRYRYNRGCAAFQSGDMEAAAAAFESVMRRARSDDIRAMATYNLGNTAFKTGDFKSAVEAYKETLRLNPRQEDARHNLEMALRALQKQKEARETQQEEQAENQTEAENEGGGTEEAQRPEAERPAEKAGSPTPPAGEQNAPQTADASQPQEQTGPRSDSPPPSKPEKGNREGQPTAREALPSQPPAPGSPRRSAAQMDRKRAEALLDNVQEDPANAFRIQLPSDKRHGVESGKDW